MAGEMNPSCVVGGSGDGFETRERVLVNLWGVGKGDINTP